jgi:hypothetical protein
MRSGTTGRLIPCCWTECQRVGDTRWQIRVYESPVKTTIYLFCGERCKEYWRNSHVSMWNLPTGSKNAS